MTKNNLMPWQPQGRFSELLQQLWPGLEAIWFCRGWDGIYSSHINDCGDLISRALSCWVVGLHCILLVPHLCKIFPLHGEIILHNSCSLSQL